MVAAAIAEATSPHASVLAIFFERKLLVMFLKKFKTRWHLPGLPVADPSHDTQAS
jgi:hypothetical protein